MTNRATKGKLASGQFSAGTGGFSTSSGNLAVGGVAVVGDVVQAGSTGFTTASVAMRVARVPITTKTGAAEVDTGYAFPLNSVIKNVWLEVKTKETTGSTKSISVGLLTTQPGGATAAFLDLASTASVQVVQGSMVAGSVTRGSLLREGTAASELFTKQHVIVGTAAVNLAYNLASAHTELVADILVEYLAIG